MECETYPFHAVRGCDLPELLGVVEDRGVGSVGKLAVVRRGTEVLLARRLRERVETGARRRRGARTDGGRRAGGRRRGRRGCRGL